MCSIECCMYKIREKILNYKVYTLWLQLLYIIFSVRYWVRYNISFISIKPLKQLLNCLPNKEQTIQYLTKYIWKTQPHWLKLCISNICTYYLNIYIYCILQFIPGHTKFYFTANNSVPQVNRFCDSNNWARCGGKPDFWNVTTDRPRQSRVWCDRF